MKPKRIITIGIIFCLGGVLAIWEVISDLLNLYINLNFAVCLLPVGIGILRGNPNSRWWATFWIVLGYIGCGLAVILSTALPQATTVNWLNQEIKGSDVVPYALIAVTFMAIIFMVMHKLLYSEKAKEYFNKNSSVG